jgi:drug/metabolite transporter (DMT)-like permease
MSKTTSLFSALLCTLIWGTTFIAQDTGMDDIGPFTFNAVRFFVGFLAIAPLALIFEFKRFNSEFKLDFKTFATLSFLIGLSLFLGSALQQVALLYTDVANAAFFTIFYVPMVPIIIFLFKRKSIHWSIWPSVVLCLIGGYLLTNFYDATVRLGDTLVLLGALFWSTHIIFTGIIVTKYNLPLTLGAIQTLIVAICSFMIGMFYEEFIFKNILKEIDSILYAGILSGGFAFVLQIYAQKNISPAPAAIIFSLEGVFATIAAWFLLDQILGINNLLGCFFILCGVLLSQLLPLIKKIAKSKLLKIILKI